MKRAMKCPILLGVALAFASCSTALPGDDPPLIVDMSLPPSCPQAFATRLTLFTRETIAWVNAVAVRPDGRFVFAGGSSFAEPEAGFSYNYWSGAVDTRGALAWSGKDNWSPNRHAILRQSARSLVLLDDGSTVIAGTQEDGLRLSRRAADGKVLWTHTWSGPGVVDEQFGVARVAEGAYVVVGSHGDPNSGKTTAFVRRVDDKGQQAWALDLPVGFASRGRAVAHFANGSVAVTGIVTADANATKGKPFLALVDGAGHLVWHRTYDLTSATGGTALLAMADGGVALVGSVIGGSRSDGLFLRTDAGGQVVWQRTFGGSEDDTLWAIAPLDSAFPGGIGFALLGQTASMGAGDQDVWLLRTDDSGRLAWQHTYGEKFWDVGYSVAPLPRSTPGGAGFLLGGSLSVPDQSERADAWLARTNENGDVICGDSCVYSHVTRACVPDGGM